MQQYPWGTIGVKYKPDPTKNTLTMQVAVKAGERAVTRLQVYFLHFKMPADPAKGWNGADILLHDRTDEFPVVNCRWQTGMLALCGDDLANPCTFGIQPLGKNEEAVLMRVDEKHPIRPGDTRRTTLSMRFATADEKPATVEADVLHAFGTRYPSDMNWPDRRPIGSAFLATSVAGYKNSPRGWFQDSSIDVTTPSGRQAFAQELSKYIDSTIAHCRTLNAQGVIIWDVEGQEMPHATSYLADPRMLHEVAPEMDPLADGMFRTLSRAGLRTGVTIRPTRVVRADDGHGWKQLEVNDPVAEMDSKISYAQRRWGCTLFYLDSNVNYTMDSNGNRSDVTMPADDFHRLAEHHKDCLLMPEHKTARYWAYTAPYCEFKQGFEGTSPELHTAYPHAFSVMQVVDGPSLSDPDSVKTLTAAINQGDILLFRPWWDDPQTAEIKRLYVSAQSGQQ